MANDTVQARIDAKLKAEAEAVFNSIGLKTSEAIRLFFQQSVNSGGLPFRPQAKQANKETLEAMQELENGGGKRYTSSQEMYKDLGI